MALIALSTGDGQAPGPESAETGSASSTAGAAHCSAVVEALRRELSAVRTRARCLSAGGDKPCAVVRVQIPANLLEEQVQEELDRERERAFKLHSRLVSFEEQMVSHQIHCPMFSIACILSPLHGRWPQVDLRKELLDARRRMSTQAERPLDSWKQILKEKQTKKKAFAAQEL